MKRAITSGYMNADKQKMWVELFGVGHIPDLTHEQWLALQEVEEVFLEYNASYGDAAYRQGLSDGILIGIEQEADGRKSILALEDMTNLMMLSGS